MKDKKKDKRLVRKPSFFLWNCVGALILLYYKLKIKVKRNKIDIRKNSLIIAPHRSYFDFVTIPYATWPKRGNIVSSTYWFRNKKLAGLLKLLGVIPKDQYKNDIGAIRKIQDCLKHDAIVYIFPEGQMSIDGRCIPLVSGLSKLIKKFKTNVYFVNTDGAYLTSPKWGKNFNRGYINIDTQLIVKEEDIDTISIEDIDNIINECFMKSNDFEYLKNHSDIVIRRKNKAEKLDNVITVCPKCKHDTIESKDHKLYCTDCDFEVEFNKDNYLFKSNNYFNGLEDLLKSDNERLIKEINSGLVLVDEGNVVYYESYSSLNELGHYTVSLSRDNLVLKNDKETISFDVDKIINLIVTLGTSFEIPTPDKTYRIYLDNPKKVVEYAKYIMCIKRGEVE